MGSREVRPPSGLVTKPAPTWGIGPIKFYGSTGACRRTAGLEPLGAYAQVRTGIHDTGPIGLGAGKQ